MFSDILFGVLKVYISEILTSKLFCNSAAKLIALIELPPIWKKSSFILTFFRDKIVEKASQTIFYLSFDGGQ